jgi:hypothetical protein
MRGSMAAGGAEAGGMRFGGGASGGAQAGPGGGLAGGGERRAGGGFTQMLSRFPEDQRKKVEAALQKELKGKKIEDLTPEERRAVFGKLRESGLLPQGGGPGSWRQASGGMPGGIGGGGGTPGGESATGAELLALAPRAGSSQFSAAQLASAKLPPPPEQDSQLDVLLRPGLLADVQIIVERITNVIHIPVQAVFERANRSLVYVKSGGKFEERFIKPLKRSENTMVISEGLGAGDIVALADPFAKPGAKKQDDRPQSGSGSPMGGFGGGGGRSR